MCSTKQRYRTMKRAWRASNSHVKPTCWKCMDGRIWRPYRCWIAGHGVHLGHLTIAWR